MAQEYQPIARKEEAYEAVEKNLSGSRPKELFQVGGCGLLVFLAGSCTQDVPQSFACPHCSL